jgi:hypothetical protein
MTGLPNYNHDAFNNAAKTLREYGWEVHNPAELFGGATTLPRSHYMKKGIEVLLTCEVICLLPGWENSEGAKLECKIARELQLIEMSWDGSDKTFKVRLDVSSSHGGNETILDEAKVVYSDAPQLWEPENNFQYR